MAVRAGRVIGVAAASLVLVTVGGSIAAWNPAANDRPDVPDCATLIKALPGTWRTTRPQPDEPTGHFTTTCELAFSSADKHTGTVSVLIKGEYGRYAAAEEVVGAPCTGRPFEIDADPGYTAALSCTQQTAQTVRSTVAAAKAARWTYVVVGGASAPSTERMADQIAGLALDLR